MSLVYVFAASPMEAEPVQKIAVPSDARSSARCGANEVVLFSGAMGPVNARSKAEAALSEGKPDAILVIGLCGGLTPSLPEGKIVAYTDCLSTDAAKPRLQCSRSLAESIGAVLTSSGFLCDRVVGITSPRIATTRNERLDLAKYGAGAVDMESYSILESAAAAGVPAAVLRVVADSMDRVLPNLNRALNESGALDGRKALKVALGSPLRTARLLAANKRAMQHLGKALEIVLTAPCFA
jgi:nucleoside phosphorylase